MLQVLLVEDNPADALLVEVALEEMAAPPRFVHVSRLSDALELLEGRPEQAPGGGFDVVLLDLGLPDSQGLSSFGRVHQVAPDLPLIALTGLDDGKLSLEALQSGASDYLIKGQVDSALLERSIRYAIERKKSERSRIELARVQAEREEAESTNRAKDEFLATLSHELRTPLNAILGWASLLRSQSVDETLMQTAFDTIERNARIQAQLIDDLLDVSRIITGKLSLEHRVLDFNEIISNAVASLRPVVESKSLVLQHQNNAPLFVCGDTIRLQQIVANLLSNAIKFTSEGGSVFVGARLLTAREAQAGQAGYSEAPQVLAGAEAEGSRLAESQAEEGAMSWVELEVRDTGQGIAPESVPQVFNRFWQADGSMTRRHGGLGIGLTIVHHLVQAHEGTISVRSEGLGLGSSFYVRLPVIREAGRGAGCEVNGQGTPRNAGMSATLLSGLRILGIDDQADARYLIRVSLASCGASVRLAASAHEALEQVRLWKPDVIVSDVGMPDMDGYEFLRCVRALDESEGGHTPSIALTGYARDEERSMARSAGFEGFVSKPVDPNLLAKAVAQLAGREASSASGDAST